MNFSFKQKLGAIVYDLPRFLWAMRPPSRHAWVLMRNRNERLSSVPGRRSPCGVACDWQWTSDLHLPKLFPQLGLRLMKRALRDWPIESRGEPERPEGKCSPALSFVIGHRGMERLPHLLCTLRSIAAQRGVSFECVVVEQSIRPEIRDQLPGWVRYVHTPLPYSEMPYSRAWAFNVGARAARAEALVLHDNDMLVPRDYAKEVIARLEDGYEVMNLKRFIFYLSETHSAGVLSGKEPVVQQPPQVVVQNLEAGGSVVITREAFFAIGGFDEAFCGWGGEDNEFWERAQARLCWPYGYLPLVHLWHTPQTEKHSDARATGKLYQERSAIPAAERIAELAMREFGNPMECGDLSPLFLTEAPNSKPATSRRTPKLCAE